MVKTENERFLIFWLQKMEKNTLKNPTCLPLWLLWFGSKTLDFFLSIKIGRKWVSNVFILMFLQIFFLPSVLNIWIVIN